MGGERRAWHWLWVRSLNLSESHGCTVPHTAQIKLIINPHTVHNSIYRFMCMASTSTARVRNELACMALPRSVALAAPCLLTYRTCQSFDAFHLARHQKHLEQQAGNVKHHNGGRVYAMYPHARIALAAAHSLVPHPTCEHDIARRYSHGCHSTKFHRPW